MTVRLANALELMVNPTSRALTVDGQNPHMFGAAAVLRALRSAPGVEVFVLSFVRSFDGQAAGYGWMPYVAN